MKMYFNELYNEEHRRLEEYLVLSYLNCLVLLDPLKGTDTFECNKTKQK